MAKPKFSPKGNSMHNQFIPEIENQPERKRKFGSGKGFSAGDLSQETSTPYDVFDPKAPATNPGGYYSVIDGPGVDNTRGVQSKKTKKM